MDKVKTILNQAVPKDISQCRSLVGGPGYYRTCIERFSEITEPFTAMTKKGAKFEWTPRHEKARQELFKRLVNSPCLARYDPKLDIEVRTDASDGGVGGLIV